MIVILTEQTFLLLTLSSFLACFFVFHYVFLLVVFLSFFISRPESSSSESNFFILKSTVYGLVQEV